MTEVRPKIRLLYDERVKWGSPERYYDFMWGYFLPALGHIARRDWRNETYIFQDYGPIVNRLVEEVAPLLGLKFEICHNASQEAQDLLVLRWDLLVLFPVLKDHMPSPVKLWQKGLSQFRDSLQDKVPEIWDKFQRPDFRTWMQGEIAVVRDWLLGHFLDDTSNPAQRFLVMRRSEQHAFFKEDGGAKYKTYGTTRRSVANIDEVVDTLRDQGFPAEEFECGAHSLAEQARRFHQAPGVAMIRGAEIANLIWMKPGASVYVLTPMKMASRPAPHDGLVDLFDLSFTQDLSISFHPPLDPTRVSSAWSVKTE